MNECRSFFFFFFLLIFWLLLWMSILIRIDRKRSHQLKNYFHRKLFYDWLCQLQIATLSSEKLIFALVTWELRKEPDGPTSKARPKKRGAFKCLSTLYENIKILDMVWRTQLLWSSFWSCPIIKWRFVFWIIASVFETLFGELNCEQLSSLKLPCGDGSILGST